MASCSAGCSSSPFHKPNRTNTVFTGTYVRDAFQTEYFPDQFTVTPHDGDTVTVAGQALAWHALDSTRFDVKLFNFAYGLDKPTYGVIFWAVTVIDSPSEMKNVRLAVGSNSASMWWLNGVEAAGLFGDRRMVMDDVVSRRLTLKRGPERHSRRRDQRTGIERLLRASRRRRRQSRQEHHHQRSMTPGASMRIPLWPAATFALLTLCAAHPALAQLNGEPYIHDPSTVVLSDGKYYTFGTGGGGLVSDDGWTWHSGAVRPGGGLAPDVIKIGDRLFVAYASKGGGLAGGHAGAINTMWTRTLDPQSPDFGFHDDGVVATTDGVEDADAIDPSFLYAGGHLWLTYGTYFGSIRLVELDPRTGKRVAGNQPVDLAIDMEATDMVYRDGWYYLFGTHGTCCDGPNSTYNIRVGRSRTVTGPFVDNLGIPLAQGRRKAGRRRQRPPDRTGPLRPCSISATACEKFSCHYEADMDRGGRSVLDIRPLLWENGWPVAGENFRGGTYEIQSERSGGALELAVDFVRIAGGRRGGFGRQAGPAPAPPIPDQTLADDSATWPAGNIDVDLGDYMVRPHQKWTIAPAADAGGYPGLPVLHDHDCRHRPRAGGNRRRRGGDGPGRHGRPGSAVAHRPVDRWHVPDHAQVDARVPGARRPDRGGREHANADQVRPEGRYGALALQGAVTSWVSRRTDRAASA